MNAMPAPVNSEHLSCTNDKYLPKAENKNESVFFNGVTNDDEDSKPLKRWLKTSAALQWDYKNIVKRKGRLERLNQ
jgi:hypothetical protein